LALIENQAPGVAGDHAAKYETSYMLHLWPELVDLARLQSGPQDDIGGPAQVVNWMGDAHRGHPCYGLVGIDPRAYASAQVGEENTGRLLEFLAAWLDTDPNSLQNQEDNVTA
jgi:creatinine amidohydrolase/Fe(II)-dependent formamide hydrolase-like protein